MPDVDAVRSRRQHLPGQEVWKTHLKKKGSGQEQGNPNMELWQVENQLGIKTCGALVRPRHAASYVAHGP